MSIQYCSARQATVSSTSPLHCFPLRPWCSDRLWEGPKTKIWPTSSKRLRRLLFHQRLCMACVRMLPPSSPLQATRAGYYDAAAACLKPLFRPHATPRPGSNNQTIYCMPPFRRKLQPSSLEVKDPRTTTTPSCRSESPWAVAVAWIRSGWSGWPLYLFRCSLVRSRSPVTGRCLAIDVRATRHPPSSPVALFLSLFSFSRRLVHHGVAESDPARRGATVEAKLRT